MGGVHFQPDATEMEKALKINFCRVAAVFLLLQAGFCASSFAIEGTHFENRLFANSYFRPNPTDGTLPLPKFCGYMSRDLGGGVKVVVGISNDETNRLMATTLFQGDEELELMPDMIELHVFPEGRIYKPTNVIRNGDQQTNSHCLQYGKWLCLKFPVRVENVEKAYLVFPDNSVTKRGNIKVRPFRFEKTNEPADCIAKSTVWPMPISNTPAEDRLKSLGK